MGRFCTQKSIFILFIFIYSLFLSGCFLNQKVEGIDQGSKVNPPNTPSFIPLMSLSNPEIWSHEEEDQLRFTILFSEKTRESFTLSLEFNGSFSSQILSSSSVLIPKDVTSYEVVLDIIDDNITDGLDTFQIRVVPPLPGKIPGVDIQIFYIVDDDGETITSNPRV